MELPQLFVDKMKSLLGEEYSGYEACLQRPKQNGIRVNTAKISVEEFQKIAPFEIEPVPWTTNGFFVGAKEQPAKHPFYHAGLYYIQEPSAMAPAAFLPVEPGDKVLDLCAAPGGKSTELGARLRGNGMLVSNDISITRTKALLKNLEMFGISNSVIVSEEPKNLVPVFYEYFDKVLVDAPCSGEGMFRKGSSEIKNWAEYGIEPYVKIQREIILDAVKMLKPGGYLLYSTCTFSPEEDEQLIEYLLEKEPELSLADMPDHEGFDRGHAEWTVSGLHDVKKCIRLWPHKIRGEGHFLALLKKNGQPGANGQEKKSDGAEISPEAETFLSECRLDIDKSRIKEHKGRLILAPKDLPELGRLRVLRHGLLLGEMKKKRFEPSQVLAMALSAEGYVRTLDLSLSDDRLMKYLKCETILSDGKEDGMYLVTFCGYPLGWGKVSKGRMKNKYAPSWRWM